MAEDLRRERRVRLPEGPAVSSVVRESLGARSLSSAITSARERAWAVAVWVAMAVWTIVLFVIVRDGYCDFRHRPLRPGEHGASRLEHRQRASARDHARADGRADRSPRWPRRSLPGPAHSTLDPLAVATCTCVCADCLRLSRCLTGLLARPASSRAPSAVAGLLALGYLAYPWLDLERDGAIHPVTFAIPLLLFCVWFLDSESTRSLRRVRWDRDDDGGADGPPGGGAGIWYALARGVRWAGGVDRLLGPRRGRSSPSTSSSRAFSGEDSIFYGFYDEVGGSPAGRDPYGLHGSGAIVGALVESHDIVYLLWLERSASRALPPLSGPRCGRAPAAPCERPLRLPIDDGSPLPQPRCGDPVPHRRDGLRDRPTRAASARTCRGCRARHLGGVRTSRRPVVSHRGPDSDWWAGEPAGGSRRKRWPRRSRWCPARCRSVRPTSLVRISRRDVTSTPFRSSAALSGSSSTSTIRGL